MRDIALTSNHTIFWRVLFILSFKWWTVCYHNFLTIIINMLNIHDSTDHSRNHSLDSNESYELVGKSTKKHHICRNFQ